ncbi:VOC family protein [Rhodoligotrophos defluvii]|uniref:VOC family protein n=1 Tax=Rhodoligotrophos defluvii TaxID=2561934 RepID=UPI001485AA6D|nr:VOC family protein [Rhodoligotrophos defluvii]
MATADQKDVHGFFHINVNCTDFERSLAFYRLIGFEVVLDFDNRPGPRRSFGEIGLGPILALPDDCDARAALLSLAPDDPRAMRLDLIEWRSPREPNERRRSLAQPGMARICLKTRDAQAVHARLASAGHKPYSPPIRISLGGSLIKVFCVEDPDGVVIEFMEFLGRDPQS